MTTSYSSSGYAALHCAAASQSRLGMDDDVLRGTIGGMFMHTTRRPHHNARLIAQDPDYSDGVHVTYGVLNDAPTIMTSFIRKAIKDGQFESVVFTAKDGSSITIVPL